jgi:hypothetical protein
MTSTTQPTRAIAPRPVNTSYWLYVVSAVLGLISFIASLIALPAAVAAAEQQLKGSSSSNGVDVHAIAQGAAIGGAVFGGLVAIAYFVLTLVFAAKMRNGRNWARIVLLVFAVLHVLGLIGLVLGTTPVLPALLSVLVTLASTVAAVLSFLPESNAWFRALKAPAQTF